MKSGKIGGNKNRYFEGWYLKHQKGEATIALIPAFHIDESGKWSASIQIITDKGSCQIPYSAKTCLVTRKRFGVKIGENIFSDRGILINIATDQITVRGKIHYGPFTALKSDIMGPFRHAPFMECSHGVLSLHHKLRGSLTINGENIDFTGGRGYIETDRGRSFPEAYRWAQCSWGYTEPGCMMVSAARIPFLGRTFTGCIAVVWHQGKEYRLGTYCGAKLKACSKDQLIISQGRYWLEVRLIDGKAYRLSAPDGGKMSRVIHENPSCCLEFKFWKGDTLLLKRYCKNAGFESVGRLN